MDKAVIFLDYRDTFKVRLTLLRKEKKCTQTELAERMGVNKATINKYEKGTASPSYEMLWKLAEFFDVSVDYLIGRNNSFNGDPELNKEITEIIRLFDSMSNEDKEKTIKMIRLMTDS